jgi:hypothetical protein
VTRIEKDDAEKQQGDGDNGHGNTAVAGEERGKRKQVSPMLLKAYLITSYLDLVSVATVCVVLPRWSGLE